LISKMISNSSNKKNVSNLFIHVPNIKTLSTEVCGEAIIKIINEISYSL